MQQTLNDAVKKLRFRAELPDKLLVVRQNFITPRVADVALAVREALVGGGLFSLVKPGETVAVGVRVGRLGTSSVTYELGVFAARGACAATGVFTHAYVDASTRRPQPLPDAMRAALQQQRPATPDPKVQSRN